MVDALTIALLQIVFSRLPSLTAQDWCISLLFAEAGRQRKPSHMDKLQSESGSQAWGHRKASAGSTVFNQHCTFFPQCYNSNVVVKATKVASCHHKNPTRTHPSHPLLVLISEASKEETTVHTHTHTLPVWFLACHCKSHYKTQCHTWLCACGDVCKDHVCLTPNNITQDIIKNTSDGHKPTSYDNVPTESSPSTLCQAEWAPWSLIFCSTPFLNLCLLSSDPWGQQWGIKNQEVMMPSLEGWFVSDSFLFLHISSSHFWLC